MIEELAGPPAEAPAAVETPVGPLPRDGWLARPRALGLAALALLVLAALLLPRPPIRPLAGDGLRWLRASLVSVDRGRLRVDAVAVHGGGGPGRERERAALALLRDGSADTIVALGGPLPPPDPDLTYAGAVRRRLAELAAPSSRIVSLDEGLSTRAELVALRRLAEARGWHRLALATSPWHTLRVRLTAAQVFGGSDIAWAVVAGPDDDPPDWWSSPDRRAVVLGEWVKIAAMVVWPSAGRL